MKTLVLLSLLALGALGAARLWMHRDAKTSAAAEPSPAPALALPDLSGRTVSLAGLRGRPVAVNFWATWCPPCRFEIPELSAFYTEHRDRCFELVGVAEDSGSREEVARAARSYGISYPVLLDAKGEVAQRFDVGGLPQTVIVDAQGRIRQVFLGAIGKAQLESALAPLMPPPGTPCPRA